MGLPPLFLTPNSAGFLVTQSSLCERIWSPESSQYKHSRNSAHSLRNAQPQWKPRRTEPISAGPHSLGVGEATEMADFLVLSARSSNSGLCSVQRKTAMPFLNLLHVMMYCARMSWEYLQETTEAPPTKSYQSPTNKKLKYIIQTKESKLLADKDNLLNPRAAHTMLCLHMSNLLIGFPLPWNSCHFEI